MLRSMRNKLTRRGSLPRESAPASTPRDADRAGPSGRPPAPPPGDAGAGTDAGGRDDPAGGSGGPPPSPRDAAAAAAFATPLPSFRDVTPSEKPALFRAKLRACRAVFDFGAAAAAAGPFGVGGGGGVPPPPDPYAREKEAKRQTLLELVDYVNGGPGRFTDDVAPDVVAMVAANLFRALPPGRARAGGADGVDPEEEEPTLEPAWPHLQVRVDGGECGLGEG